MSVFDKWDAIRLVLGISIVLANVFIWRALRLENEFDPWTRETGRRLLIKSSGILAALSIFLLVADTFAAIRERAAIVIAEKDAGDAKLQLAKYRAWRQELLAEHETEIVEKLKPFAGTKFDTGLDLSSAEQAAFLQAFMPILASSHWLRVSWSGGNTIPLWIFNAGGGGGGNVGSAPVTATNVEIHVFAGYHDQLGPAADALISALNGIGIVTTDAGPNAVSINKDAIHIWIGDKR
jgi:hypothetical protein